MPSVPPDRIQNISCRMQNLQGSSQDSGMGLSARSPLLSVCFSRRCGSMKPIIREGSMISGFSWEPPFPSEEPAVRQGADYPRFITTGVPQHAESSVHMSIYWFLYVFLQADAVKKQIELRGRVHSGRLQGKQSIPLQQ